MNFNNFDINPQAMAVMAYLGQYDGIESSWSEQRGYYVAEVKAAPWYNGRERGIVFYMRSEDFMKQLNIAIYEHRNTDVICAILWEQVTGNPPTLAGIPEDVFKDKYDYTESWSYGRALDAAKFVKEKFEEFWKAN